MNNRAAIGQLLRALADAVERASDSELEKLLKQIGAQDLSKRGPKRRPSTEDAKSRTKSQAFELMLKLAGAATRDEAADILDRAVLNKAVLLEAAKIQNIHTLKQDNIEVLRMKLIENVVGSRLDSAAIRGTHIETDTQD